MSKAVSVLSGIAVLVLLMVLGGTLFGLAASESQVDPAPSSSVGTAFTYQGHLTDSQGPANGSFDLTFSLYDDLEAGNQVGTTISRTVTITDGLLSLDLDFGSVFDGTALWLEIRLRPAGDEGPYTPLEPRQRLAPTPLATFASIAPWTGLTGIPGGFDDGVDDDTLASLGCTSGQIPEVSGSTWTCGEDNVGTGNGGGDITAVTAGYGLGGGSASGDASLYVVTETIQARVGGTCPAGWSIRAINQDGSVICERDTDTTYSAGAGLTLSDTTLAISSTYLLPYPCVPNQIAKWNGSAWECASDQGSEGAGWSLTGNSGTVPGTNFLGTTDNVTLEIRVNASRVLLLEPGSTGPNIVGGYSHNSVDSGLSGATIAGGGRDLAINQVTADFGAIGGGAGNAANGYAATIGGGEGNSAGNSHSLVGGGSSNVAGADHATVGGGESNTVTGTHATISGGDFNEARAAYATVGGGGSNLVSDTFATISGGWENEATGAYASVGGGSYNSVAGAYGTIAGGGPSDTGNPTTTRNRVFDGYGTVGGGGGNVAGDDDGDPAAQAYATVSGGSTNTAEGYAATVSGGSTNKAGSYAATVGGGSGNSASNQYATIGGGSGNTASGSRAVVAGGQSNSTTSSYATVGGGSNNIVSGTFGTIPGGVLNVVDAPYGFAAGRQARAEHTGTFVWSDSSSTPFASTSPDQFLISAAGGVGIGTNAPSHLLTVGGNAAIRSSSVISAGAIVSYPQTLQAPRALYAVGDLLYAAGYATNTLSIWNVSDPTAQVLVGYTTFQLQGPVDLQVVGNRAYLASQNRDMLTILDVSDPADISHVGDTTEYLDYPQGVHVSGKYAYVASMGNDGRYDGLTVFDVTDAPAEIAATSFVTTYLEGTSDVFVVDSYAYVTSRDNHRLVVFDVSDPRSPTAVSYTEASLVQPVRVHVSGIYAYVVAEGANAVVVYDVSNPAQIAYLGQVTTSLTHPRSLYVSGDRAYVAYAGDAITNVNCGLAVLDISDPTGIAVLNVIDMSDWELVPPEPVAVTGSGDRIYVANERLNSVTIFEIDSLEASAVRTGELQVAHLEVADYAAIEGDLGVRGGLNVGPGGALVQGTLSVEGAGDSYIQGRLGIGPVATVITRSVSPTESEEIIMRHPTHQLDVDGEARFRVNDHNHLVLRSRNTGSDEDAYIDFVDFAYPDLITPSARIEFDAADPITHSTSLRFYTQGPDDSQPLSRLEITSFGDVRPGADAQYLLGTPGRSWHTVYSANGMQTTSDGRLKENVVGLPYGLDAVRRLRPVAFTWKDGLDDQQHHGLIAQEVAHVLPDLVRAGDDPDRTLSMNYAEIVPVLVKAIQQQQDEIDTQAGQIAALEARLVALENGGVDQTGPPGTLKFLPVFGFGGLVLGAVVVAGMRRHGV